MLEVIFKILAIYSITFAIKETSLLDIPREWLMKHSVFFFKLISCAYCLTTHSGYLAYLLFTPPAEYAWRGFLLWALAGGPIGLIFNGVINKLYAENK
jgi:hypothetical protein